MIQRNHLLNLSHELIDAFNRQNIKDIMKCFAKNSILEDSSGSRHEGKQEIQAAFELQFKSGQHNLHLELEDFFSEPDSQKVMIRWTMGMNIEGEWKTRRGIDILRFDGEKIIEKLAYTKLKRPESDAISCYDLKTDNTHR